MLAKQTCRGSVNKQACVKACSFKIASTTYHPSQFLSPLRASLANLVCCLFCEAMCSTRSSREVSRICRRGVQLTLELLNAARKKSACQDESQRNSVGTLQRILSKRDATILDGCGQDFERYLCTLHVS